MEDNQIIKMLFERNEQAISEASYKYYELCKRIAYNILDNKEDCEEAINDVWLKLWNSIPPEKPDNLAAYLTILIRNTSLDLYRKKTSVKRTGDLMSTTLDEISDIIPDSMNIEDQMEKKELVKIINRFLETLPQKHKLLFIRRYYYFDSIRDISLRYSLSEGYITATLTRVRKKLAKHLKRSI